MARLFDDASSQYLEGDGLTSGTPLTLACWFYSDDVAIHQTLIAHYWYNGVSTAYEHHRLMIRGAETGDPVAAGTQNDTSGYTDAVTSTGYSANTWHHAAGVWASTSSRSAYIDGGSKGSDSTSRALGETPNTFAIGYINDASRTSGIQYMSGRIAEVGIWNVALTDTEVAILAKGYSPLLVRPQSLVFYAPLASGQSPELDIVGGYDMTLYNTPTTADHAPVAYTLRRTGVTMRSAFPLDNAKQLVSLLPRLAVPPASNYGVFDIRNGHPVIAFDDTTAQSTVFDAVMPQNYKGGDIAVLVRTSGATATSGDAKVGVEIERLGDGQQDVDSDGFGDQGKLHFPIPATSGYITTTQINLITAATRDSIAAGEKFRLRFTRVADETQDDMSGDLELHSIELRELA